MNGLSYDWIYALVGFLIMLGILGGIGINKPRGMSVKMWCVGYLAVALGFDALVVLGLVELFVAHKLAFGTFRRRSHGLSTACNASYQRRRCTPNFHELTLSS